MAERQEVTRACPEATTKLLEKGEGFRTKHTSGLNASGDEVVCGQQVRILGLLLLLPVLPPNLVLWNPRQYGMGPECRGM